MPFIRDLSKPAVDHPLLQEVAQSVKKYGLDKPDTIMGVGAPRADLSPQSILRREILQRLMGQGPGDPAETFGKGMMGNLYTTALRKGADGVKAIAPSTASYIDHPIDSLMKLIRGEK